MTQLFSYRAADGVWRERCAKHIKSVGPYRAVTKPVPSDLRICVECRPWGQLPTVAEATDDVLARKETA